VSIGQTPINFMIRIGYVPISFGQSYTVPITKSSCNVYGKVVTVDDFRGVSISPVISKVSERCILDHYGAFFNSDNHFGFKNTQVVFCYVLRTV